MRWDRPTFPANDWLLNHSFDEPPWKSSAFSGRSTSKGEECMPLELCDLAFEFTARSNAQKGRALQPNGEKRSHGVDSFIRQPNHNFHEIPLPISLTQQDHRVASPSLTGSSRCRLQVIFSGISAQGITSGGSLTLLFLPRCTSLIQSRPGRSISLLS